jgi:hypothetical protein
MSVKTLSVIVGLLLTIVGAVYAIENHFTPRQVHHELKAMVEGIKEQLKIEKLQGRIEYLEKRIYDIEWEYGKKPESDSVRKILLDLKSELILKRRALDAMFRSGG